MLLSSLLADISNAIADEKSPIVRANMSSFKDITASFNMLIEVKSQDQFDRIIGRIKAVKDVIEVKRGH